MPWLGKLERWLLILGILLIGFYVGARIHGVMLSRAEVQRFKSQLLPQSAQLTGTGFEGTKPDVSLWSEKRIHDYQESLASHFSPAVAILRIPKIHLEVPVLVGTDDVTLNRAVGLIAGTAQPGETGNIGIAGHRDGFFRGLKDVGPGDTLELATQREISTYVIDQISIVAPSDVSVLAPRAHPSVSLVTCYPFYFVGSAPQRYIVQASVKAQDERTLRAKRN
jgi:sortase A